MIIILPTLFFGLKFIHTPYLKAYTYNPTWNVSALTQCYLTPVPLLPMFFYNHIEILILAAISLILNFAGTWWDIDTNENAQAKGPRNVEEYLKETDA